MIKPNNISPIKDYTELLKENENLKKEIDSLKRERTVKLADTRFE